MPYVHNGPIVIKLIRKKGINNNHFYKCQILQKNEPCIQGQHYVNSFCGCRQACTVNFTAEDRQACMQTLFDGRSKNEQDLYLMNLIIRRIPARRRNVTETNRKRENTFNFYVWKGSEKVQVCRNAFCILYSIRNKALFRLTSLVALGEMPCDMRGKHGNRANAIPEPVCKLIYAHAQNYPPVSALSVKNQKLDVKALHRKFCTKYPELGTRITYDFYRKCYKEVHDFKMDKVPVEVQVGWT